MKLRRGVMRLRRRLIRLRRGLIRLRRGQMRGLRRGHSRQFRKMKRLKQRLAYSPLEATNSC